MEMLIVIALIAVLIAIAIPVFASQLEKSREATDLANVRAAYAQVSTEAQLGNFEATVTVDLKQKQADWQSMDPVNIRGIIHYKGADDTNNWKGVASPGGNCVVSYEEAVGVALMVLAGKINKTLVNLIELKGGSAIGLSGLDGHMLEAKIKKPELGYVGEITNVNVKPILDVLDKGYIPVVSTVGYDDAGNLYNINADTAAARIAGGLGAESLIAMTDIAGILKDKDDPSTLLSSIRVDELPELVSSGVIQGGMIPKAECCRSAIEWGVNRVFIIDGRVPHAILIEMLTNEGIGTMFTR